MSLAKGVLGAFAGGIAGGALWVGVAYATGYELSLLAIVLGGAVGFGMGMGNQGRGGAPAGVLAAIIALVCICGAKLGVAYYVAQHWIASHETTYTEEDARAALCDQVYSEFESVGIGMSTPDDEYDYPPEVWREADRRWHAMSVAEREQFRVSLQVAANEDETAGLNVLTGVFFVASFIGIFPLICLVAGVSTAYKTASTVADKADEGVIVQDTSQAPAMFRMAPPEPAPATRPMQAVAAGPMQPDEPIHPMQSEAPSPAHASAPSAGPLQPEEPAPTGLGIFAHLGEEPGSSHAAPAMAAAPAGPLQPQDDPSPENAPESTGGIFARLGQDQTSALSSEQHLSMMAPEESPEPEAHGAPPPAIPRPKTEVGLIDLDIDDERQAA